MAQRNRNRLVAGVCYEIVRYAVRELLGNKSICREKDVLAYIKKIEKYELEEIV